MQQALTSDARSTNGVSAATRYRFGCFDLQPGERRLQADSVAVHVGPHAFDVLVALVDRAGRLVTKHELLQCVWGNVVVEENNLQAQISALRKIVGTDAITTVSGQGYRFALSVHAMTEPAAASALLQDDLPHALTSFIGREREIAEIRHRLTATRLLTLTGAGGCGKTRLALQVANTLHCDFPGGVRLVELAPLGDPRLVPQAVAKALTIETLPGRDTVETLVEWLAPRRLLLVLDNAEHVLESCASLVDSLLRRCPHLVIVATSRERLRIDGELTYRVPSLSVPDGNDTEDSILACDAVRLFVDRARLQRQDFEPTGKDTAALASICRRLDGIALAIELAAPYVRMMALEELNVRLGQRFAMLTGGSRTALPRHRTLRSLMDWGHDLLNGREQIVLHRVSVFAGGWTVEAAEHVCCGSHIERGDILDLLRSLEDKSLVVVETNGGSARFAMLETLRDYAQQKLRESGGSVAVYGRLTEYIFNLAAGLHAGEEATVLKALRSLDAEHDNLRVALAWCENDPTRALDGLRLAALLLDFWRIRGHYAEGLTWLSRFQAASLASERGEIHAMALHASGSLLGLDSDLAAAAARLREAVGLWRQLGDRRRAARAMVGLAEVERYGGNTASARAACEEALPISREFGDLSNVAQALTYLADVARLAGDYKAAEGLLDECLSVSRIIGGWSTAATLHYRAMLEYSQGDFVRARSTLRESLPGYREFGDRAGTAAALMQIARISQHLGEVAAATSGLREAWDCLPGGNDNELLWWLDLFAGLLAARDSAADAARLWGCIARHREERGLALPDSKRKLDTLEAVRSAMQDEAAFNRAWTEGQSWSLDEARKFARDFFQEVRDGRSGD